MFSSNAFDQRQKIKPVLTLLHLTPVTRVTASQVMPLTKKRNWQNSRFKVVKVDSTINILTNVNDDHKWCLHCKCVILLARVITYTPRIINYTPKVTLQIEVPLTYNSKGIIYGCNMFIVQAKGFRQVMYRNYWKH